MNRARRIITDRARASRHALVLQAPAWAVALALVLALPPALAQPRKVIVLDRIVAVVNDQVITRGDLDERVRLAAMQLKQQGAPLPPSAALERQVLDHMITDRAQLHLARETGLRVDDAELDRAVERIARENQLTPAQLRAVIEKDGIPYSKFREDIRSRIIVTRLREREVDNRIVVAESEIDNFIGTQQAQAGRGDEFNLSHILVTVPENASPEQIQARRARIERALEQLKSGADFRQVAAAFSEAPDALQGGSMGWRDADRLPTLFMDALKSLAVGAITPALRSSNGFHILKLNERRGSTAPVIVRQTHARHILMKANELVPEAEARRRLVSLKERLDNKGDFADLARGHSEDASNVRGGDLGWLSPGDTVPEFERAMDALAPGAVSEPVKTPFGWHLIQVLERRNEDMSRERQRLEARRILRARKSDESYQEWVRQLRDRAYIEYRLEER
ncbi:MAG: molecular chaperone SurA [Betaproteobacteria bacterium RIFCSPLOWO2_02_FULL_67_26]|nr:MAG: molecular chaperone SurA [Betaproteobacteria bacterium RIFCSPLOWO2_02_FULL_67_26]